MQPGFGAVAALAHGQDGADVPLLKHGVAIAAGTPGLASMARTPLSVMVASDGVVVGAGRFGAAGGRLVPVFETGG